MILSDNEFKEFIKPLQEVDTNLHKAKIEWLNHMQDIKNKAIFDWDISAEQEVLYTNVCEAIGQKVLDLYMTMENSEKELMELNEKL